MLKSFKFFKSRFVFGLWRWFVFLYSTASLSISIAYSYIYEDENEFKRFLLYMTNHAKIMLTVHGIISLLLYHKEWIVSITLRL